MKKFIKIAIGAAAGAALAVGFYFWTAPSAPAQFTPSSVNVFGANDNGTLLYFGVTNRVISSTQYYNAGGGPGATNGPGMGGPVDVSAFEFATLWMQATNATGGTVTNTFSIVRGYGNPPVFETTAYKTVTLLIPTASYICFQTNLLEADLAGAGYLQLSLLTNTTASGQLGLGIAGDAYTNSAFPYMIGVSVKILHSLR